MVVRHGRTSWNASGRFQGQHDVDLDDVGEAQAEAVADCLAALAPTRIRSSDLSRARRTAEALGRRAGLTVEFDARLREIDLGEWQGLTRQEAETRFPEDFAGWVRGDGGVRRGGGETPAQVGSRVAGALTDAVSTVGPGAIVVAVSHGLAIRSGVARLTDPAGTTIWRDVPHLHNGWWLTLRRSDSGWAVDGGPTGPEAAAGPFVADG